MAVRTGTNLGQSRERWGVGPAEGLQVQGWGGAS